MTCQIRTGGAFTFENDDAMQAGLSAAEDLLQEHENSFLSMKDIETIGLHLTAKKTGAVPCEAAEGTQALLEMLAAHAYSGYMDITINDETERYHAKEIEDA